MLLTIIIAAALVAATLPGATLAIITLECPRQRNTTVVIGNGQRAHVHGSALSLGFQMKDTRIYTYPKSSTVNILLRNVTIGYKGYMRVDYGSNTISTPEKINQIYTGNILGIGQLTKYSEDNNVLKECRLFISLDAQERPDIPVAVDSHILKMIDTCLDTEICYNFGSLRERDLIPSNPTQIGALLDNSRCPICPAFSSTSASNHVQSTVNKIVDIAIEELSQKLREKNEGNMKVPKINEGFSKGSGIFEVTGRFEADEGVFSDLTTIKRTSDAVLSHSGLKFSASCGFGLERAHLHYEHYKMKLGFMKVSGKMTGDVDGVALRAKVSVDYQWKPCKAMLEELEVTEFGKLKINVTGMGPLNSWVSSLINWVSKKWRDEILHEVQKKLKKILTHQLDKFQCEKYRP